MLHPAPSGSQYIGTPFGVRTVAENPMAARTVRNMPPCATTRESPGSARTPFRAATTRRCTWAKLSPPSGATSPAAQAEAGLAQIGVEFHRNIQRGRHDVRGVAGAFQRRAGNAHNAAPVQQGGGGVRLGDAVIVERHFGAALRAVGAVPIRFAMAQEPVRRADQHGVRTGYARADVAELIDEFELGEDTAAEGDRLS